MWRFRWPAWWYPSCRHLRFLFLLLFLLYRIHHHQVLLIEPIRTIKLLLVVDLPGEMLTALLWAVRVDRVLLLFLLQLLRVYKWLVVVDAMGLVVLDHAE